MSKLQDRLALEMEARQRIDAELNLVNETNGLLRQELSKKAQECDYFKDASYKYAEGFRKLLPIVESFRDSATFTTDGSF